MKIVRGPSPLVLAAIFAFTVATFFVVMAMIEAGSSSEAKLNSKYVEKIAVKTSAFKSEVWVNGKKRPDCALHVGSQTVSCSKGSLTRSDLEPISD